MHKLLLLFLSATTVSLHKAAHAAHNGPINPGTGQITPTQALAFAIIAEQAAIATEAPPVSPHAARSMKYAPNTTPTKKVEKKTQKSKGNFNLTQPGSKGRRHG